MSSEPWVNVNLEDVEGGFKIAVIQMNRPKKLNAWGPEMQAAVGEKLVAVGKDDTVDAAIITGPKDFWSSHTFSYYGSFHPPPPRAHFDRKGQILLCRCRLCIPPKGPWFHVAVIFFGGARFFLSLILTSMKSTTVYDSHTNLANPISFY